MIRRLLLALAVLLCAVSVQAQTLSPSPYQTIFDNSGLIVNAGCVWTYLSGTSTPVATYTTSALNVANGNPIIASSAGRFTAFLTVGVTYRFVVENVPCSASGHGSVLMDVSGISATPQNTGVDTIGIAGATLTAGSAVYLSAGDGGKLAGEWYPADIANTYSSVLHYVGVVPLTITSGSTGTIRLSGLVSGLTALTPGANYFIGTNGAMTTSAAANTRIIGQADTTTTMIVTGNPPPPTTPLFVDDFRITPTTATCVPTSDVTAVTTLFFTPCVGNRLTLFNTTGAIETCALSELSLSVPGTTSQMYDVFVYDSSFGSCTGTMEFLAWQNDNGRATSLTRTSGRWTKTGDSSRLYVGSFRTTTVNGQTEDILADRSIFNYYNRVPRALKSTIEPANSWAYSTKTWRQANANTANKVTQVVGIAEVTWDLKAYGFNTSNAIGVGTSYVGIGLDSTTAVAGSCFPGLIHVDGTSSNSDGAISLMVTMPAIGFHTANWLEAGDGVNTNTWLGDNGDPTFVQTGLMGTTQN